MASVRDRTWLVAVAAALWGTDGLLRAPLSAEYAAATIVFLEHLIVVIALLPLMPRALRAFRAATARERAALLAIGAGASAVATVLFTLAFRIGDPVTPLALQKLQPVFALTAAWLLLGERLRPRFGLFVVPALVGAWLLTFADPFAVELRSAAAAALAIGAAALWASGTVLGRMVSERIDPPTVTALRFAIGLPTSAVLVVATRSPVTVPVADVPPLIALALLPGLLALSLYYRGLRTTPASRATLAELAFPATAALVGVTLLDTTFTGSQWAGFLLVVVSVTALSLHERTSPRAAVSSGRPAAAVAGAGDR